MNADFLLDALESIDADLIEAADRPVRRRTAWRGWAAAACVCLLAGGAWLLRPKQPVSSQPSGYVASPSEHTSRPEPLPETKPDAHAAQRWTQSMPAADYFRNNADAPMTAEADYCLVMPPFAAAVSLNGERTALEDAGMLPEMPTHPEQSFTAEYSGDGSLYKVWFHWMRRDEQGLENYSDLILAAAPEQRNEIGDCIVYEREAPVTVTERDGILITAEGCEGREKTLTWQTDGGWYQISGSWNDSFEDMVALLDWFWDHPLDLAPFASAPETVLRFTDRSEYPDAFRDELPDAAALGYTVESERLSLAEETPVWFEGVYTRGETRIRWTLSAGADKDAWDACPGRPAEVTREVLEAALTEKDYVNLFFDKNTPYMATLYLERGTSDDAWELIQSFVD